MENSGKQVNHEVMNQRPNKPAKVRCLTVAMMRRSTRIISRKVKFSLEQLSFVHVGYVNLVHTGIYVCSKCNNELFHSSSKYEHSSDWPAFTSTVRPDSVSKYEESPGALKVSCGKCGNDLGHEFLNDGPKRGVSRF